MVRSVGKGRPRRTFPKKTVLERKLFGPGIGVASVNKFNHIIDTEIGLGRITRHLNPKPAVGRMRSCPHPDAVEKVKAENFPHIHRVVLEPFEIEFLDPVQLVRHVFIVFGKVKLEVAVVPARLPSRVHHSLIPLGPATGRVALETKADVSDSDFFLSLVAKYIRVDIFGSILILVKFPKQPVPLRERNFKMKLRNVVPGEKPPKTFLRLETSVRTAPAALVRRAPIPSGRSLRIVGAQIRRTGADKNCQSGQCRKFYSFHKSDNICREQNYLKFVSTTNSPAFRGM